MLAERLDMAQPSFPTSRVPRADDHVLEALARIEQRLSRVEDTLERTTALAERAPALVAMITDTLDQKIAQAGDGGIDIDERLHVLLGVAERLTTPSALRMARALVENLDAMERLLVSGVLAPGPVEVVSRAGAALSDVEARGVGAWGALRALRDPDVQRALGFALEFARRFGRSLDEAGHVAELPPASQESR